MNGYYLKNYDAAIADRTKVIEFERSPGKQDWVGAGDLASSYESRARFYLGKQAYPEAIADLDTAIALYPQSDSLYWFRARVKFDAGDMRGAIADASRVLEMVGPNSILVEVVRKLIDDAKSKL